MKINENLDTWQVQVENMFYQKGPWEPSILATFYLEVHLV